MSKPYYYAVTGRIPGDDEDGYLCIAAQSKEDAVEAFKETLYAGRDGASREQMKELHGDDCYITHVFISTAPIASTR